MCKSSLMDNKSCTHNVWLTVSQAVFLGGMFETFFYTLRLFSIFLVVAVLADFCSGYFLSYFGFVVISHIVMLDLCLH